MLIGLSSKTFDLDGDFLLDVDEDGSTLQDATRRVSRDATLDGGAVMVDYGFCHGDREVILVLDSGKADAEKLWQFFTTYAEITLALPDGVYNAAIEHFGNRFGKIRMSLLIHSAQ